MLIDVSGDGGVALKSTAFMHTMAYRNSRVWALLSPRTNCGLGDRYTFAWTVLVLVVGKRSPMIFPRTMDTALEFGMIEMISKRLKGSVYSATSAREKVDDNVASLLSAAGPFPEEQHHSILPTRWLQARVGPLPLTNLDPYFQRGDPLVWSIRATLLSHQLAKIIIQ